MTYCSIQLTPCDMEIDMSIVDRITALLNRPAFLSNPKAKFNQMYQVNYAYYFACIVFRFDLTQIRLLFQEKQTSVDVMLDDDCSETRLNITSPRINARLRY